MKTSIKTGLNFGVTSGVITTLGLMVGLESGTSSKIAVVGGILTIAIADAFSDALGIHIAEESKKESSTADIWLSTASTFFAKLVFGLTFIAPVMLLPLQPAVLVSIIWGLLLLTLFSYYIARQNHEQPWAVIGEHVSIAIVVIVLTHYVGHLVKLLV